MRGVVEGFYGPPWSHEARLDIVDFLVAHDLNAYVYAPKDDLKHRERWREPYEGHEAQQLAQIAAACRAGRVRFGFALSPGLDMTYADQGDRAAVIEKLAPLLDAGVDWVVLALDDIPARPGLAAEQADLAGWLLDELRHRTADVRLTLVPTEYVGTRPSDYLRELDRGLPADLDVMWTGPTVCSPTITADDARGWGEVLSGRPLLLWDNYPVNDAVMTRELHLGPYRGRTPELTDVVDGVLLNPMLQPHASKVALAVAAEYLCAPDTFDERAAWGRAIEEVGGERACALGALARACAYGPLLAPSELPAHVLVDALATSLEQPTWVDAAIALRDELDALRTAGAAWRDAADDPLARELRPWTKQAALEAEAGLSALRLIQHVRALPDDDGHDVPPDAELALVHVFAAMFAWSAARDAGPEIVLGPRFALHTAVVQLADGSPGVDVDLSVHEDGSVVDRLCRLALDAYRRWASSPSSSVRTRPGPLPFPDPRRS